MKKLLITTLCGVFLFLAAARPTPAQAAAFDVWAFMRDHIETIRVEIFAHYNVSHPMKRTSPGAKLLGCYPDSDNATDASIKSVRLDKNGWVEVTLSTNSTNGVAYNCVVVK
jgi:hypothetical protein